MGKLRTGVTGAKVQSNEIWDEIKDMAKLELECWMKRWGFKWPIGLSFDKAHMILEALTGMLCEASSCMVEFNGVLVKETSWAREAAEIQRWFDCAVNQDLITVSRNLDKFVLTLPPAPRMMPYPRKATPEELVRYLG